jgi:hypothetical protein
MFKAKALNSKMLPKDKALNSKMLPKDKALNSKMIMAELDQIISQPAKCPVSETSKMS